MMRCVDRLHAKRQLERFFEELSLFPDARETLDRLKEAAQDKAGIAGKQLDGGCLLYRLPATIGTSETNERRGGTRPDVTGGRGFWTCFGLAQPTRQRRTKGKRRNRTAWPAPPQVPHPARSGLQRAARGYPTGSRCLSKGAHRAFDCDCDRCTYATCGSSPAAGARSGGRIRGR